MEGQEDTTTIRLFVIIFPGFEPLDIDGPVTMLSPLKGVEVSTVLLGPAAGTATSSTGRLTWVADLGLPEAAKEAAKASGQGKKTWLLVPGGTGTRTVIQDAALLAGLALLAARADLVMSVCTGAALLAAAGLLEGLKATTNKRAWTWATSHGGPGISWVRQARWIQDGRFFTAAGVSAGMDMAIAVAKSSHGEEAAHEVALRAEYEPHEDSSWDPFGIILPPPENQEK